MRPVARTTRTWLALVPLGAVLGLITLIPAFDALISSVTTQGDLALGMAGRLWLGLDNYRYLLRDRAIFYSLNITMAWATANVLLSVGISLLIAQYLHMRMERNKGSRKRRLPLLGFLLIPLGIPIYIAVPLWRALLHGDAGLSLFSRLTGITLNLLTDPVASFWGSLLVSVWMNLPLTTFVLHSHLSRVEAEVLDSARLETKSRFETMCHIQFPAIRTSVLIMTALNFVKASKEFTLIHLLTDGGAPMLSGITEHHIIGSTTTLGIFLYDLFTSFNSYGLTAAFSVIMGAVVIVALTFWMVSTQSNPARRQAWSTVLLLVLMIAYIPLKDKFIGGGLSFLTLVIILCFLASFRWKPLLALGSFVFFVQVALEVRSIGFLAGFSPLLSAVLFVWLQAPRWTGSGSFAHLCKEKFPALCHRRNRRKWTPAEVPYLTAMYVAVGFLVVSSSIIVYYLVWLSISGLNACAIDGLLPRIVTLRNFQALFTTERILSYFLNTAIIATTTAILTPLVVIPAAWYLSTIRKQRANLMVSGVHALGTIGGMHSLIPLFAVFLALGLLDSYLGLALVYTVHAVPFALITIKNFFEGDPRELREPALLEGATASQYIRWILIPLSHPIIKTAMILAFLGAWNGFTAPLILLTDEALYPVSLKLYSYVGSIASGNPRWNLFAAASVLNLLFIRLLGGRRFEEA